MTTTQKLKDIPWFAPSVGEQEKKYVIDVLNSNYLNDGSITRRFEAQLAQILGVQHCVGVTSGTAAITLALMALGVGPGDEVIVPDLTFIATANAVTLTGATVKLVDVEPHRLTLDPEKTKRAITSKTKAIVPVDVNGRGANYEFFEKFCREKEISLVCDAAEALGSKHADRMLGSFGDAGCISFSANKTVTTGQGGMIATNNTALYHRLLELKDQGRRQQGSGGDDSHPVTGFNFKLTNLQSAVGLAQLEALPNRLKKAQERDAWYRQSLEDCAGIKFPGTNRQGGEVLQWTDILIEKKRENVRAALDEQGIGHRAFWYPLHTQGAYPNQGSHFEVSTKISASGLWLPSYFGLTQEEAERTAVVIRKAIES